MSSRSTLSSCDGGQVHRLAVVGEDDLEAGLGKYRLAAHARHGLNHNQLAMRLVEAEDAEIGNEPDIARLVAGAPAVLRRDYAAGRTHHFDALDQRCPAVARRIDHIVPVHVGDIRHPALPWQPQPAARRSGQFEVVGSPTRIDLRRPDDLVRHEPGLVVGRIGVVAAAMSDRRLRIHGFEKAERHRAGSNVDMPATERADEEIRRMGRLGQPVGDIAERGHGAGAREGLVVEHPRDPHHHQFVDACGRIRGQSRRCGKPWPRSPRPELSRRGAASPTAPARGAPAPRPDCHVDRRALLGSGRSRSHRTAGKRSG